MRQKLSIKIISGALVVALALTLVPLARPQRAEAAAPIVVAGGAAAVAAALLAAAATWPQTTSYTDVVDDLELTTGEALAATWMVNATLIAGGYSRHAGGIVATGQGIRSLVEGMQLAGTWASFQAVVAGEAVYAAGEAWYDAVKLWVLLAFATAPGEVPEYVFPESVRNNIIAGPRSAPEVLPVLPGTADLANSGLTASGMAALVSILSGGPIGASHPDATSGRMLRVTFATDTWRLLNGTGNYAGSSLADSSNGNVLVPSGSTVQGAWFAYTAAAGFHAWSIPTVYRNWLNGVADWTPAVPGQDLFVPTIDTLLASTSLPRTASWPGTASGHAGTASGSQTWPWPDTATWWPGSGTIPPFVPPVDWIGSGWGSTAFPASEAITGVLGGIGAARDALGNIGAGWTEWVKELVGWLLAPLDALLAAMQAVLGWMQGVITWAETVVFKLFFPNGQQLKLDFEPRFDRIKTALMWSWPFAVGPLAGLLFDTVTTFGGGGAKLSTSTSFSLANLGVTINWDWITLLADWVAPYRWVGVVLVWGWLGAAVFRLFKPKVAGV